MWRLCVGTRSRVCVCVTPPPLLCQATKARSSTFEALQQTLDDLVRRMVECEERNTAIVSHLTELDSLLQDEKAKWSVH